VIEYTLAADREAEAKPHRLPPSIPSSRP
jgi:hypothetical protein